MDTKKITKIKEAFEKCSQPRTNYQIENFVVKEHETLERQYSQCVTELWRKTSSIRRAELELKKLMDKLEKEADPIEKELILIDIDELTFALMGATREF